MTPRPRQRQGCTDRMRDRRLRNDWESRLAELGVPANWDIDQLCDLVAEQRGRPIRCIPVAMSATHPCGFWIATEPADLIVYESDTSRAHQEHIIAHELAHIICCHRGSAAVDDISAQLMFPDLDPNLVRDMLRRTGYSDDQEHEAEVVASMIMERINRHRREPPPTEDTPTAAEILRIERSLTYRMPRSSQ